MAMGTVKVKVKVMVMVIVYDAARSMENAMET